MGKDTHLVNIYLKIHNKRPLTMDDLRYLAEYAPECFEKTCKNVVYNRPETKPLMEPKPQKNSLNLWGETSSSIGSPNNATTDKLPTNTGLRNDGQSAHSHHEAAGSHQNALTESGIAPNAPVLTEQETITAVLENLMRLEADSFPIANIEADEVKNLLGNLYMELLFPHNDKHSFFQMTLEPASSFDRKA